MDGEHDWYIIYSSERSDKLIINYFELLLTRNEIL